MTNPTSSPDGPRVGERIRIDGYPGPFFVTRVDEERQEVDLIPVTGSAPCLEAVPIAKLRPKFSK